MPRDRMHHTVSRPICLGLMRRHRRENLQKRTFTFDVEKVISESHSHFSPSNLFEGLSQESVNKLEPVK